MIQELAEVYVSGSDSPTVEWLGLCYSACVQVSTRRASLPNDAPCHPSLEALAPGELHEYSTDKKKKIELEDEQNPKNRKCGGQNQLVVGTHGEVNVPRT